jgi:hypothetical protein
MFKLLPHKKRNPAAFEIVKGELGFSPAKLLRLKDESELSDEGVKVWLRALPGLVCPFTKIRAEREAMKADFKAVLLPQATPDGMAVHLPRLIELLKVAYPSMSDQEVLLGVNMDATTMGSSPLTSASVRFLNDALRDHEKVNSRRHEFDFALYEGKDEKIALILNVFRTGEDGNCSPLIASL